MCFGLFENVSLGFGFHREKYERPVNGRVFLTLVSFALFPRDVYKGLLRVYHSS